MTVAVLTLMLVACGGNVEEPTESKTQTEAPTESESVTESTPAESESDTVRDSESESESAKNGADAPESVKYLKSDTGTQLNMLLEYDVAKNEDGSYTVDTTLKLECYSLSVSARPNSNYIKIGDENYYFATEGISYDGDEMTTFTLGTHRFEVSSEDTEIPVYAIWYFNGVYNDKPITAVIIDGAIELE